LVKVKSIVSGGDFRQDSVWRGLQEVSADADVVLIHDCARPFVTKDIIEKCIEAAWEFGAAVPAVSVKNTVKKVSDDGFIEETVDRNFLWEVQTPQTFTRSIIIEAHQSYNNGKAAGDIEEASDDAYLVEKLGGKVKIVESSYDNFKITTPNDVLYADFLINDSEDK
jgi:2-C-methyl-D-erythritol 4-phosphate cytidylyltransferase